MPSPIAHCKQFAVFLVVSLFLMGCAVMSCVGCAVHQKTKAKKCQSPVK